jgi:lipoyl(octanoyl) transferase
VASSDISKGRLILDEHYEGSFNMAADLYLSEYSIRENKLVLRLYGWSTPTVSLGFHQKIGLDQSLRCHQMSLPIVRRPTGGRAVLHNRELTYCLTIPKANVKFGLNLSDLQKQIGQVFVTAAKAIGLPAELIREGYGGSKTFKAGGSPLCFDSTSRWEVKLAGSKWIGSAQRYYPEVILQHGSILIGQDSYNLADLFGRKQGLPGDLKPMHSALDSVSDVESELRRTIPEIMANSWNIEWERLPFDTTELAEINMRSLDSQWRIDDFKPTLTNQNHN